VPIILYTYTVIFGLSRANIGIGDVAKVAAAAANDATGGDNKSSKSAEKLAKLPYSLKAPLLTRKQQEDAAKAQQGSKPASPSSSTHKGVSSSDSPPDTPEERDAVKATQGKEGGSAAAAAKTFLNFPGLNISLGTSLSSYLLDLLDSPAYGNLTPEFLNNNFNPSTPDRDDVRYFSVAAKASKLSVTHPLWLPQLIMDKTEEGEKARDLSERRQRPEGWSWGNDGLVPVESAKWGELYVASTCQPGRILTLTSASAPSRIAIIGLCEVDQASQQRSKARKLWRLQPRVFRRALLQMPRQQIHLTCLLDGKM